MKHKYMLPTGIAPAIVTSWFAFLPLTASANQYMAGQKDSSGDICSCPVTVGNCVCKIVN